MASGAAPAPSVDVEYLKMIQSVIDRLAQNSFQTKSWSIGLATAILAAGSISQRMPVSVLAFFPAICFGVLDAYYLRRERLFRSLYDAASSGKAPRFSMDTRPYHGRICSWGSVLKSPAILLVHVPIIAVIAVVVTAFAILTSMKGSG